LRYHDTTISFTCSSFSISVFFRSTSFRFY